MVSRVSCVLLPTFRVVLLVFRMLRKTRGSDLYGLPSVSFTVAVGIRSRYPNPATGGKRRTVSCNRKELNEHSDQGHNANMGPTIV